MKRLLRISGRLTGIMVMMAVLFTAQGSAYVKAADSAVVSLLRESEPLLHSGDSLSAAIQIDMNSDITSMVLDVQYDSNILSYVGDNWNNDGTVTCHSSNTGNSINISVSSKNTLKDNAYLVTLTFSVKEDVPDTTTFLTLVSDTDGVVVNNSSSQSRVDIEGMSPTQEPAGSKSGNKVVIVAPTAVPSRAPSATAAPTAVPTPAAGAAGDTSQTTSLNINNDSVSDNSNPVSTADNSAADDSDEEMLTSEPDKSSSSSENSSSSSSSSSASKSSSSKDDSSDEDAIPKTGVFRWEYIFSVVGFLALITGTVCVVRYNRKQKL